MRYTVIIATLSAVVASVVTTAVIGGSFFGANTASSANTPAEAGVAISPSGVEGLIQGDVDCGKTVTPVDSLKVLRHDAGLSVQQDEPCPDIGTVIPVGEGVPGPQGPQGEEGPAGPQGQQGPAGPSGISDLQVIVAESENNSNTFKFEDATCPAGTRVIAGGTQISGVASVTLTTHLIYSYPYALLGETWRGGAKEHGAGTTLDWRLFVYAICANVAD